MQDMMGGVVPPPPTGYKLPTRFPDLRSASRIVFDVETKDPKVNDYGNGVYRKDGKLVGAAIAAWDKHGVLMHAEYYPWAHRAGPNLDEHRMYQYFGSQLNFFKGELAGTNLLYDGDWGQSVGIVPAFAQWRDIQWAEALIDEMAFTYRLQALGTKWLGAGKVTEELKRLYGADYITRFDEVHPGHARAYGLGDVLMPNAILTLQIEELKRLGLYDLFLIESRLTPFLLYLRRQGVRVDLNKADENIAYFQAKRFEKYKAIRSVTGLDINDENRNNKRFLEHLFENKLKIKIPRTKPNKEGKGGGEVSITDAWLHNLCTCKKDDPDEPGKRIDDPNCGHVGRSLEAANKYFKAEHTFTRSYIHEFAVGDRVHGDFHPLRKADDSGENGTESGRLSGSNPNLQNIPARDKEIGPRCRAHYIPEQGGQWWVKDYSQIEYRWLIHMASIMPKLKGSGEQAVRREKSLAAVYSVIELYKSKPETDFHQALADLVTKVLGTKFPRGSAKNLNFGLVYGMGLQKLATDLNMLDDKGKPNDKVQPLMDTYHGAAPFVKDLYDLCLSTAADTGEIRTILNRRSQFEFWEPTHGQKGVQTKELPYAMAISAYGWDIRRCETHKALNRLLQGSAADMMKMAMVLAWEAGIFTSTKDFTCSLTVHDELDGTLFPTKRGEECSRELTQMMLTAIPMNVPCAVGEDVAANWAEAK